MPSICTFVEPMTAEFKKSSGGLKVTFEAGRDYLLANTQLDRLMQDENFKSRVYKVSRVDSRLRSFNVGVAPSPSKRESVLLFNGSGGFGDQIMTWPVAALLAQRYDVHVLTDPGNNICWWNLPFVKAIHTLPIQWSLVQLFDHHAFFESVTNLDEHAGQRHPVDTMLYRLGFDPTVIPPAAKVAAPNFSFSEMASVGHWGSKGKIGIYQLASANRVRCLTASDSVFHLIRLAEAYPDVHWLAVFDEFVPEEYPKTVTAKIESLSLTNVQLARFANLRELWALTTAAAVVVGPDSMMVHVAGATGRPCVGLWGPVPPQHRVGYYRNHFPIYHPDCCPHAPCFAYTGTFPVYCPPTPGGLARTTCNCLSGISSEEVVATVGKALAVSR